MFTGSGSVEVGCSGSLTALLLFQCPVEMYKEMPVLQQLHLQYRVAQSCFPAIFHVSHIEIHIFR